jgi:hypothetical protein
MALRHSVRPVPNLDGADKTENSLSDASLSDRYDWISKDELSKIEKRMMLDLRNKIRGLADDKVKAEPCVYSKSFREKSSPYIFSFVFVAFHLAPQFSVLSKPDFNRCFLGVRQDLDWLPSPLSPGRKHKNG